MQESRLTDAKNVIGVHQRTRHTFNKFSKPTTGRVVLECRGAIDRGSVFYHRRTFAPSEQRAHEKYFMFTHANVLH